MDESSKLTPTPLLHGDWTRVHKKSLEDFRRDDWNVLDRQRRQYLAERQADEVIRMLEAQKADASIGYTVNMYQHGLQTATKMLRDDLPEEDVVVGLLHDIGFIVCSHAHGEFAALLLRPFISEKNDWMLRHHGVFQQAHYHERDDVDPDEREKWRGHPHFEWTEEFVAKYDQSTINYDDEILPIEEFVPMVRRVFSKE